MLDRKLDLTFPNAQFKITGFKIFIYDRNRFGGGLLLDVNDNIPSKFLNKHSISSDIELIAVEFYQNKHKWLSLCVYKSPNQNDSVFVKAISAIINKYSSQYEHNYLGDFNLSFENSHLQNLMQIYNLCSLIKEPTCFQSHNPTCIGNFLANQKAMFKLSRLFETGLSDHHRLISVVYRSYKNFTLEHFSIALKVQSCILYNNKYGIASTQITNSEIFALVAVLIFKL